VIFGSTLLSLAMTTASVGDVAPQARAIAEASEVLEVDAQPSASHRSVPSPRQRIQDPATADERAAPLYLGCGPMVPACERLTTVGMISGGAGVAVIAGSTALLLTPNQVIADEPTYVRNYDRVGTTLLALGIGLATTGVLMVLTAARASRSRRTRRPPPRQLAAVKRR